MASTSNIDALKRAAEVALMKLQGKRYLVGDLSNRLQVTAEEYRHDTVIQAMSRVIEKLAVKNPEQIISQAEIELLYNELVGLNASGTKCREVLNDLFIKEASGPTTTENLDFIGGLRDDPSRGILGLVSEAQPKEYDILFGESVDRYDPQAASDAKNKVSMELHSLGLDKTRVRIAGGNSRFIVFAADLDTNRGMVRILVPAEASGKQLPSVFVAGNKFETLTRGALKNYLEGADNRTDRLPTVKAVLNSLDIVTGQAKKALPDEDFSKLASLFPGSNNSEGLSGPGLFASLPDERKNIKDVEIPLTAVPKPLKSLASEIEDSILEASVGYPPKSVQLAKKMVVAELASMGFKGTQIMVSEPMQDGFVCKATLNTQNGKVTIDVPIEMNGIVPLMPSVFAYGDQIADFNPNTLKTFAMKTANDGGFVQRDCQLYSMDIHQLKDLIIRSATNGDFDTCDEVIGVIADTNDSETYRNVIANYQRILLNVGNAKETLKQAQEDSSQFIKTSTSMYPIHKKLGRPAHELVRDENGEYHLKSTYYSRQNQEQSGAFFSNSKVLVGD